MFQPVLHGYYRYTDINFEWHQVFENPSDRSALKGFLAPDSLTHPDNPLNAPNEKKEPGITLTIGTLDNGESRLLFSSKQIEYIRYWLFTVGYTEYLLPLPASNYLLTSTSLKSTEPVIYKTPGELKNAVKDIQKNNKRLKGTDKTLLGFRDMFALARTCWLERKGTWLSVDFEAWEYDHTVIIEYGWSTVVWDGGDEKTEDGHVIVEEHQKYQNSKYVANNQAHFLFGKSQVLRLKALRALLHDQIKKYTATGPLYLVFHDFNQDLSYLKQLQAPIDNLLYRLPDVPPTQGIYLVDTSALFAALEGRSGETRGLSRMCQLLQLPDLERFHNAGNDAHYTMLALKSMVSGDVLDKQRATRWPGQDNKLNPGGGKSVSVEWKPHQIDSDYDDLEGIFPSRKSQPKTGDDGEESDSWAS